MTLSTEIKTKVTEYLPIISYAVGYDISDESASGLITALAEAGMEDMLRAGVSENTLKESKVVLSALIIFVNDNLNMSAGKYVTSPMYLANVDKLRELKDES